MAEFVYNNANNASTSYTSFELNCNYHPRILYEEEVNPRSKSKSANKLSTEPREPMIVCQKNLNHTQELQKQAHDKGVKPRGYAPGEKVWLNSKYIKTKWKQKLKAKFFRLFQVLHPVWKQAYKLELSRNWKIHDVFHLSLLKYDITKKGQVDEEVRQIEFDAGDNDSREYVITWPSELERRALEAEVTWR